MRAMKEELQKTYRQKYDHVKVDFRAVEWHGDFHSQVDNKLDRITIPGNDIIRQRIVNQTILDVIYYLTPHYRKMILNEVGRLLNDCVANYLIDHPSFEENGEVHILAHSLGSVICYDLLSHQLFFHLKTLRKSTFVPDLNNNNNNSSNEDNNNNNINNNNNNNNNNENNVNNDKKEENKDKEDDKSKEENSILESNEEKKDEKDTFNNESENKNIIENNENIILNNNNNDKINDNNFIRNSNYINNMRNSNNSNNNNNEEYDDMHLTFKGEINSSDITKLNFTVNNLFLIGSPLGMFLTGNFLFIYLLISI